MRKSCCIHWHSLALISLSCWIETVLYELSLLDDDTNDAADVAPTADNAVAPTAAAAAEDDDKDDDKDVGTTATDDTIAELVIEEETSKLLDLV